MKYFRYSVVLLILLSTSTSLIALPFSKRQSHFETHTNSSFSSTLVSTKPIVTQLPEILTDTSSVSVSSVDTVNKNLNNNSKISEPTSSYRVAPNAPNLILYPGADCYTDTNRVWDISCPNPNLDNETLIILKSLSMRNIQNDCITNFDYNTSLMYKCLSIKEALKGNNTSDANLGIMSRMKYDINVPTKYGSRFEPYTYLTCDFIPNNEKPLTSRHGSLPNIMKWDQSKCNNKPDYGVDIAQTIAQPILDNDKKCIGTEGKFVIFVSDNYESFENTLTLNKLNTSEVDTTYYLFRNSRSQSIDYKFYDDGNSVKIILKPENLDSFWKGYQSKLVNFDIVNPTEGKYIKIQNETFYLKDIFKSACN